MADGKLQLDISDGEVKNAIAVALAESFTDEKRDALIRDVVRAHLSVKDKSYSRETLLSASIGRMIREAATEAMNEIMDSEMKPKIQAVVRETIGDRFKESVYNQVRNALRHKVIGSIQVTAMLEDDD